MCKNTRWPSKSAHCRVRQAGDILCTEPGTPDERRKNMNDQGTELEGTECGVVLLPPVEQEEKE